MVYGKEILFPFLVYCIKDNSIILLNLLVECCRGTLIINHLIYADDFVVFNPSMTGLRRTAIPMTHIMPLYTVEVKQRFFVFYD